MSSGAMFVIRMSMTRKKSAIHIQQVGIFLVDKTYALAYDAQQELSNTGWIKHTDPGKAFAPRGGDI
jgi:hypothetical protein